MIAAQLWESLRSRMPEIEQQIARGEFGGLFGWLREHVHGLGAKVTVKELMKAGHRPAAVGHGAAALPRDASTWRARGVSERRSAPRCGALARAAARPGRQGHR